jgi:hypothetical protein
MSDEYKHFFGLGEWPLGNFWYMCTAIPGFALIAQTIK